jgi:hypothetical protein
VWPGDGLKRAPTHRIGANRWTEPQKRINQPVHLALVGETRRFGRFFRKLLREVARGRPSGAIVPPGNRETSGQTMCLSRGCSGWCGPVTPPSLVLHRGGYGARPLRGARLSGLVGRMVWGSHLHQIPFEAQKDHRPRSSDAKLISASFGSEMETDRSAPKRI